MTMGEFERGQDNKKWPVPTIDTTPSLDGTDAAFSLDITAIGQYIRSLSGIIQVTSEPGAGTIFSLELPFDQAPLVNPRKPRHLFLPTSRTSIVPPTSHSPLSKSPNPMHKEIRRQSERAINQAQPTWQTIPQSSSIPPPSHKALPARPSQHEHVINGSSPLGTFPHASQENVGSEVNRHSFSNLNILIADDDPLSRRILDEQLSQWGHAVDITCDGQDCHDRFASNIDKYDIILMDLKVYPSFPSNPDYSLEKSVDGFRNFRFTVNES
jgi:CheY-like chemotaxis protein